LITPSPSLWLVPLPREGGSSCSASEDAFGSLLRELSAKLTEGVFCEKVFSLYLILKGRFIMARGILIFGSAGAGKRTLGDAVSKELGFAHINTDDLFWRRGMKYPYTLMLPREERKVRLVDAIWMHKNFVLSGNLDTISEHFEPMFDLVVYLTTNTSVRLERLQKREYEKLGERILEGGDLYPMHRQFLHMAARYDSDGFPNADMHSEWANTLACPVLRLSGDMAPEVNAQIIAKTYRKHMSRKKDA